MGTQPNQVQIVRRHHGELMFHALINLLRRLQLSATPAVDLRMAVRESYPACSSMIAGRKVNDLIRLHIDSKLSVINAIVTLVHENQCVADRHPSDLALFSEWPVPVVPRKGPITHPNAHGHRPHHWKQYVAFLGDNLAG